MATVKMEEPPLMWSHPPADRDIQEVAEAAHDYFGTGWRGSVALYYSVGGDRKGGAKLHLYETDTIRDMEKRATHGQFPLCALYRALGAPVSHYREAIEKAIKMKEEGSI